MQKFMEGLYNLVETYQPIVWIVVALALFIIGIGCIVPMEEVKEKCKKAIPWVVIGCGLAICATAIAKEISSAWIF